MCRDFKINKKGKYRETLHKFYHNPNNEEKEKEEHILLYRNVIMCLILSK